MPIKNVLYLSKAQYEQLVTTGYITLNGVTYQYNDSDMYCVEEDGEYTKRYGIKRALTDTSSTWTRTYASVDLQANATHDGSSVINAFDTIYPWSYIKSVNINVSSKQVVAEYGDVNFTFNPASGIEVMTRIPSFYLKRYTDSTYEYIEISKSPFDGATFVKEFYVGRYSIGTGNRSITGLAPLVNQTIGTMRTNAKAKASGWGLIDIFSINVIQCLYLVEYADNNSQTKLGQGRTLSSNTSAINSGSCDTLGMRSGCLVNDGTGGVIYRGIENIFGNVWQWVDGVNIKDRVAYVNYNPSTYASDVFTGDYKAIGYTNASSDNFITKMGYDPTNPIIMMPQTVGSTDATGYTDYYWQNTGNRVVPFGGPWHTGSRAGMFYWSCINDSSYADSNVGSRFLLTT